MPVLLLFKKSGQKRIREPPQNLLLESSLPTKQANCVLLLCDVCLSLSSSPLPQPTPMQVSAHPCLSELIGALHASSYNCLPPANTHTPTHTLIFCCDTSTVVKNSGFNAKLCRFELRLHHIQTVGQVLCFNLLICKMKIIIASTTKKKVVFES